VADKSHIGTKNKYFDYGHQHLLVAALLPIAERVLATDAQYTHILKIDCDSYFAGGNVMGLVAKDISAHPDCDLFLVDRTHPLMGQNAGMPGVGFTLWRKGGPFIPHYLERFDGVEQRTILRIWQNDEAVKTVVLKRPGFHFVLPFSKIHKKREFSREMLEPFLPAYFHVHGIDNMEKMKKWFPWEDNMSDEPKVDPKQNKTGIWVFGHQRCGNHYVAALISENFLHLPCYAALLKNHIIMRKVPKSGKYVFVSCSFETVAPKLFNFRHRLSLRADTLEEFLSKRYCDMYDPTVEAVTLVNYRDGSGIRKVRSRNSQSSLNLRVL